MGEEGQVGRLLHPLAQSVEADGHQLWVEEGDRSAEARHQAAGLPGAGGGSLVEGVDRVGIAGIDADLAHQGAGLLEQVEVFQQRLRAFFSGVPW